VSWRPENTFTLPFGFQSIDIYDLTPASCFLDGGRGESRNHQPKGQTLSAESSPRFKQANRGTHDHLGFL
jgi:hypothetical protein